MELVRRITMGSKYIEGLVAGLFFGPMLLILILELTGHFHHYNDRLFCVW